MLAVVPSHWNNPNRRRRLSCAAFLDLLRSKPAAFIHDHVRNILFGGADDSLEESAQALSKCTGAMNVMLYYDSLPLVLPSLSMMPLLRLSANLGFLFGPRNTVDFQHPVFERLTHLAIFDWETAIVLPSGLALMPCLTHLSFTAVWKPEFHTAVLAQCPRLQVLAVLVIGHSFAVWHEHHTHFSEDARTVLISCLGLLQDWELGTEGGADYWVRAEHSIAKRRTGVVKGKSRPNVGSQFIDLCASEFVVEPSIAA